MNISDDTSWDRTNHNFFLSHSFEFTIHHHQFFYIVCMYIFPKLSWTEPVGGQGFLFIETLWSHSDTQHSVGLLSSNDQPERGISTWQRSQETDIQAPAGLKPTVSARELPLRAQPRGLAHFIYTCKFRIRSIDSIFTKLQIQYKQWKYRLRFWFGNNTGKWILHAWSSFTVNFLKTLIDG